MKKNILFLFILLLCGGNLFAQITYSLSGTIKDKSNGESILGASIALKNESKGVFSDEQGNFQFGKLHSCQYELIVNLIGYETYTTTFNLTKDMQLDIQLQPTSVTLSDIIVNGSNNSASRLSLSSSSYARSTILDRPAISFSRLLPTVPGVATIDIGSGISKPLIRGLGFNRIAVINKGIVQQNQQWGADHGMEINQFDISTATVHKGASSLQFGSDAMAGAIEIEPYKFKAKDFFNGEAVLWGASNNDLLGAALRAEWQKEKWYINAVYSHQEYADFRVPADNFNYLSYEFPIYNRRLKNTAGKEQSAAATIGFRQKNITTYFNVTDNYQKMGFFAGAHGIPNIANIQPDNSFRNIGMPYTTSNHFTITNNTEWKTDVFRLAFNAGYQNNNRKEFSYFHSHFQDQPAEGIDPTYELGFRLETYSANARLYLDENKKWKKTLGIAFESQQNRIGGYSFFLPRFDQIQGGLFFINNYEYSNKLSLQAGIRYDIGKIDITGFYDPILAKYLENQGKSPEIIKENAWRAYESKRNFGSYSGSLGFNYKASSTINWKASLGKSFRFPTANELAANGVHHAAFRHERGNPNLDAEQGYSLDLTTKYDDYSKFRFEVTPFVNYFSNFIYLQPTTKWSILPEGGQIYNYQQSKAMFGGAEYTASWHITHHWELSSMGAYVTNQNLDTHYPLPFTPPFMMTNEIKYAKFKAPKRNKAISYYQFSFGHQWIADQNRVAQAEDMTPGATLFHLSAGFDYKISSKSTIRVNMQVQNIFDTRYLNHLSFYRKINIPEPGRNIQLFIRIPFNN